MSLQIVYGRSGSGKTTYILNEIAENIDNGFQKYIITPEQFSLTAEKELLKCIKNKQKKTAVINAEVLAFNRIAHRVALEVGGASRIPLSNSGKAMLIYSILEDKKKEIQFLGKSSNNINIILNQISELKKHGISLEYLEILMNNVKEENKYLFEKLKDIYTVYSKYDEKIEDKYIDESDILTVLLNQLEYTDIFKDTEVYIDEFVGFTKQEYLIIEKILKVAKKVTVTICTDSLLIDKNADTDVFYSNKKTANKLMQIAEENDIKIENPLFLKDVVKFNSKELKHIESNIFKIPYTIYNEEVNNLNIFLANNRYSEVEYVAKQIIKLVRDKDYKFKDIFVLTENIDTYNNLIRVIFDKYNIPVYIDTKKELNNNILVKYMLSVLEIFAKGWRKEDIINYVKTGFVDVDENDIFLLEKYANKWNIRGNSWLKDWDFKDKEDIGDEKYEKIINTKQKIIFPLVELKNSLSGQKTVKQISKNLYEFLIENNIEEKFKKIINEFKVKNELNIASEYETSWNIIMEILDEMVMIFGDEKITFEDFIQMFKVGINNTELGTLPMMQDEVIFGDVGRSRSSQVKVSFIIGVNDGSFPKVYKEEGFLDDEDRKNIESKGFELAKTTMDSLYEENFNIYKVFTMPTEKIYISYSSQDEAGASLRPSIIISKIKKMFKNIIIKSDIITKSEEIIIDSSTFDILLDKLRNFKETGKIDDKWLNIYNIFMQDEKWKEKLKQATDALDYSNKPEVLTKDNLDKLYGNILKTIISKLEKYKQCPFSYFIEYGLKLNSKDSYEVASIDTGTFMHDIIDNFFEIIDEKGINIKEISSSEINEIINDIVEQRLSLNKYYIYKTSPKYINLIIRLKKVLSTSIKYIVDTIKQSDFEVFGHEVEFGHNARFKPIIISTDSGKTVEITGKIDRIDIAKNQDGTYVRIIDYKSSIKDIELDKVVAGLQLQLLTYLTESCEEKDFLPAGALYFNMIDPSIKTNKNITDEEIEKEIRKQFKMNGLILADVNVVKMMDKNIEENGTSQIIPASINKSGELSARKSLISQKDFSKLQKYMKKILKQISEEILSGNIDLKPIYNPKVQKGKTACEYCKYKSICKFDVNNSGNTYNYLEGNYKEKLGMGE